jgi:ParB-like chromosome segregation protein Spo0J
MNMREFNIFDVPVHPAADAFPMMEEEELKELAADIEVNGLQQPLVLEVVMPNGRITGEMFLIDGRNRREACQRAGVVPDYVLLDGQDPVAYILSANINRRHMTKGQRAMATCLVSKHSQREKAKQAGLSNAYIAKAELSAVTPQTSLITLFGDPSP